MKIGKSLLAWTLTVCLLIAPFSGSVVFAFNSSNAPIINANINTLDYVTPDTEITVNVTAKGDTTITACDTRVEGVSVSTESSVAFTPAQLGLTANRVYTIVTEATDSNNETAIKVLEFRVVDSVEINFTYAEDESIVPSDPNATAAYYKVDPLEYSVRYGSTQDGSIGVDDAYYANGIDAYELQYYNEAIETKSVSGIPYQQFDIALNGKTDGEVAVRYTGSTFAGERIAVKVYNPATNAWDVIGTFNGSDSVSYAVDVATYNDNDIIHVIAVLDYETNGSDTMIWSTDPQHYTKFEDLYDYYYRVYQYAAEQYTNGEAGYIITTGDLVDDRPNTAEAVKQWQVSDQAMSYVDDAGMPNGLVSGNHDVGDFKKPDYTSPNTSSDYSKFWETFPASRYNDKTWYGGSLNNNASHYDLITIGNVDFVVLYLAYGYEATDETIVWANDVLERYSHRTAIVTTHQYLEAGEAVRSSASRAQLIFDKIVDPNPNVKVVLCGHDDGSLCLPKTASDGRTVYEILSDYQFVEAEDPDFYENEHYIGSVPHCCGDGYIRLMTVTGTTLTSVTYSPITGRYNPYGDRENLQIDLGNDAPNRSICTAAFSAYVVGEETENALDSDTAIVIKGENSTTYHHVSYYNYPDSPSVPDVLPTPVDHAALTDLIAIAEEIDTAIYTDETVATLEAAIDAANAADYTDDAVSGAYVVLEKAIGALAKVKETIDPSTLDTMYNYDLGLRKWMSSEANVLITASSSHIKATATEKGGIHMTRSAASTNTWPSARYSVSPIVLKPVNGKVYVNLDVDADSSWCIYLEVEQGSASAIVRLNFAIENAFNNTESDGFEGVFQGVYDVTEAFTENGLDPNATLTIKRTQLFIVPGDVTYDHIELLTDKSDGTVDASELQELIDYVEALDESQYTSASWKTVNTAVTTAKSAINNSTSTQSDINLQVIELQKAIDKLKSIEDIIPEPEGSLLPADEGLWVPSATGTLNVYRDNNHSTVIQNTNGQWPHGTYTPSTPFQFDVGTKQLTVDVTVGSEASILLNINGTWVTMNSYITSNLSSAGDLKAGTYTVDIPLSKITEIKSNTAKITAVRVFSVGAAASSAVTIRKLMMTEYVAPPYVEETALNLLPKSMDNTTSPSETGSHEILKDGSLVIHSPAEGYRVQIVGQEADLFNMAILNAIHLEAETDVPFKIAFHIGSGTGSKWINTSESMYSHLFTIENDRIVAGSYDVDMEIKDYCSSLTDREHAYMNSITIVTTGEGTLTINALKAIKANTFVWDEDMTTYGPAATPDNPYAQHCAQKAPDVYDKVDILAAIGLKECYTNSGWVSYGNQSLGLKIDLAKTPYLYYSIAQPANSNFTFGIFNNNSNCPYFLFRDATGEGAFLGNGVGTFEAYTNHEQYMVTSETGCIDMRQFLYNKENTAWVINNVTFYNTLKQGVVVSYLFFGSEPVKEGDINLDGTVGSRDALMLYQQIAGHTVDNPIDKDVADFNGDGKVTLIDAMVLYRVASGVGTFDDADIRHPVYKQ